MLRTISVRGASLLGLVAFVFVTGAVSIFRAAGSSAPATQPIAFNHRKHVKDLDLACSSCHQFYETETFSGLPDAEVCSTCHAEQQGKSKEEEKLVKLLKAGAPLQWASLFRQPAHVFYSHRRHVVAAKIECAVCHGSEMKMGPSTGSARSGRCVCARSSMAWRATLAPMAPAKSSGGSGPGAAARA